MGNDEQEGDIRGMPDPHEKALRTQIKLERDKVSRLTQESKLTQLRETRVSSYVAHKKVGSEVEKVLLKMAEELEPYLNTQALSLRIVTIRDRYLPGIQRDKDFPFLTVNLTHYIPSGMPVMPALEAFPRSYHSMIAHQVISMEGLDAYSQLGRSGFQALPGRTSHTRIIPT